MKNLIMFFVLVMVMVFSSYEVSYSQESGNFYFLIGTEGNERAIMYLHIFGNNAYGSYYTKEQAIEFNGSFDGKNLQLGYGGEWDENRSETINKKYITGTLSGDIVFRGKHNSKNINLTLAKAPINTMKIFSYLDDTKIIHLKYYNEIGYRISQSISYIDDRIIIIYSDSYTSSDEDYENSGWEGG